MKTSELIEFARATPSTQCKGCVIANEDTGYWTLTDLVYELADKLDMALEDLSLKEIRDCETCVYNIEPIPHICVECSNSKDYYPNWQWRGDTE